MEFRSLLSASRPDVSYLTTFAFGAHTATHAELSLTPAQEGIAFPALEHCATYVSAVQAHTVLERLYPDPFNIPEPEVQSAFHAARLIRNAFAHDPFDPIWEFGPTWDNRVFTVPNVIILNTASLNGRPVRRAHYGGPLSILKLLSFCESTIETIRRSRAT